MENYLSSCVTRATDGAYVARFPWRTHHPPLPSNYTVAERRTRQLAKRLATQPKLLQLYHQIIADQEARDFIERVDTSSEYADTHYIPHHAVEKDSPTTPTRIVFDCSCRQSASHPALNDCLEIGVPCSNDICSILIRFSVHQFGFSGDIEKAFLPYACTQTIEITPSFSGYPTLQTRVASFIFIVSR